ncbi:MBOAT family O-acyltransferase [Urechidicola croceus]|uniref:Membrane-bound O-acyltransferase family protein n=1 Tax=Urechidicola croceus TaxID=1850246 RepID=A0A1D8P653_9FLAO|nr:MBOAT family O-acyltransferase [Urechidicola croceus]AOW20049.1 hypothetical protein LPB138_04845 [Urechidicola croceus]
MLFNSFVFFFFLSIILPIFYALPSKKSKNIFLLICSYFFYGYWDWRFCFLLLTSTIIDFIIGEKIFSSSSDNKRKWLLRLSLFTNLGILCVFKYFNFFIENFKTIADNLNFKLDFIHLNILLPIGISFYTFQTLSYTIDIYNKKIKPTNNFVDFALFVSFFPQLVAGPIERAKTLLPQLSKKLNPSFTQIKQGITLIILGLFRKVMIGDTAGRYVDHIFNDLSLYKSIEIIAAIILFSIQIYADFSGYSHIARGTAKLLGVELMKNFEQPYFSQNIAKFWRRWHISLSTWLRDYLYFPLGGNRKGLSRTYLNLMITMLLGGLWHGASWNFVIWGGLHGVYLILYKMYHRFQSKKNSKSKLINFGNYILTFFLVTFTWLFFRSENYESTEMIFSKIINWETSEYFYLFLRVICSYLVVVFSIDYIEYKYGHTSVLKLKSNLVIIGILSGLFLVTLMYMFQADSLPFVYFQF